MANIVSSIAANIVAFIVKIIVAMESVPFIMGTEDDTHIKARTTAAVPSYLPPLVYTPRLYSFAGSLCFLSRINMPRRRLILHSPNTYM